MASIIQFPGNLASVSNLAALRALPSFENDAGADVLVEGGVASGDGAGGTYVWSASSLEADDGTRVIRPSDLTTLQAGRWKFIGASTVLGAKTSLAALKATPITETAPTLVTAAGRVDYAFVLGDFTGQADDARVVKLNDVPLVTGALVRQTAASLTGVRGGTVANALDRITVSITDPQFGAVAAGTGWGAVVPTLGTDNAVAINAAVAYVAGRGGGDVVIPAVADADRFFGINSPVLMKPSVNIVGEGPTSRLRNCYAGSDEWRGGVFLMGNLHPAFLQTPGFGGSDPESAAYYQLEPFPTRALAFTLTTPGDAAAFTVGDQLAVASKSKGVTAGYQIAEYMILCTVVAKAGAVITVDRELDIPGDAEVAILKNNNWRGAGYGTSSWYPDDKLFFWSGMVRDLSCRGNSFAAIDSALCGATVETVAYEGYYPMLYGNAWQHVTMTRCRGLFHIHGGELSENSYKVRLRDNYFGYRAVAGKPAGYASVAVGSEYIRQLDIDESNTFDFGDLGSPANVAVIRVSGGQEVVVKPRLRAIGSLGSAPVVGLYASGASATFPVYGNRVGASGGLGSLGRALFMDGNSSAYFYDNLARDLVVTATYGVPDTVLALNVAGPNNGLQGSNVIAGNITKTNCTAPLLIRSSYVHEGYGSSPAGDDVRGLTDRYSATKRAFNAETYATVPENATTTVLSRPLKRLRAGDRIEVEFWAKPVGTGADKTFRLALWNDTDNIEIPWPSSHTTKAQAAAVVTPTVFRGVLTCYLDTGVMLYEVSYDDAAPIRDTLTPTANKDLSLRILCTVAAAGTTVEFAKARFSVSHPVYDYGARP